MKRVGVKPGQLVRSASRRNKTPTRFQFDITIDRVVGVKSGWGYFLKWSRGVKVATTKYITAAKEHATKAGLPVQQKMSLMVTLYRAEGARFDAKDAKLSLVTIHPTKKQERTVGKIHFDLSHFAGVPSASHKKTFRLSDKYTVHALVESRFVKAGPSGPGSAGASSAMSGISARTSEDDDDLDDDFDDLALDDIPEPEVTGAALPKNRKQTTATASRSAAPVLKPEVATRAAPIERKRSVAPSTSAAPSSPPLTEKRRSIGASTSSPKRVSSPMAMFRGSAGKEEKQIIAKLETERDRLQMEIRKADDERNMMIQAHKKELDRINAQVEEGRKEAYDVEQLQKTAETRVKELEERNKLLEQEVEAAKEDGGRTQKEKEQWEARYRSIEAKNKDLGSEIDRLTVAVGSTNTADTGAASEEVERRLKTVREEKEKLEKSLKRHQEHAASVRGTYEKLSQMYEDLRDLNVALQNEVDESKIKIASLEEELQSKPSHRDEEGDKDEMTSLLEEARRDVRYMEESKAALQSDYDRTLYQLNSLQDRFEKTSQQLDESQREAETLITEAAELKSQRDMAMQRALSRGKSLSTDASPSRSIGRVEEELRATSERYERERERMTTKIVELEQEIMDQKEDLEYEKAEKVKARDERDKIRDNVRELERRTSQAARQDDQLHSLRRQLSTVQMRDKDQGMMIEDLRAEKSKLEEQLERMTANAALSRSSNADELSEVLQDLVSTKLALAQAEDDKLNLQFSFKQLRKSEKAIQQKLASHASRLEVKLGQANEELEKLRRGSGNGLQDASEFNELGSDVDY